MSTADPQTAITPARGIWIASRGDATIGTLEREDFHYLAHTARGRRIGSFIEFDDAVDAINKRQDRRRAPVVLLVLAIAFALTDLGLVAVGLTDVLH